jgi:zinc/manganese transport system permease protein/manganese/iron transport system permease protein
MTWLTDPFATDFMVRALLGGAIVAAICALVGTGVVIRGMAFLGEAMAHGTLPGVAAASLFGLPPVLGAAASAAVMSIGVSMVSRRARLSHDTSIGLLFVGMLALGVIIVSHSRSFAVDLTAILFGDILAIDGGDIVLLFVALTVTLAATALFHRAFVAAAFDTRVAATMGLHPRTAHVVLVGLVTLAIVVSYGAVGSLLVIGLLLAPAVAASGWSRRIPFIMLIAALFGTASVLIGLLLSWHSGTAAGASIALSAIALAACSALLRRLCDHSASPQKDTSAPQPPLHDPSPRPPRLAALGGLRTD